MRFFIAALLICCGILFVRYGDKKLDIHEGQLLKSISHTSSNVRLLKWVMGTMFILLGLLVLLNVIAT